MIDSKHVFKICDEACLDAGYELVDLEFLREQGGWILRVYIDHLQEKMDASPANSELTAEVPKTLRDIPRSLISHEDCRSVSLALGEVLDKYDVIPVAYHLEVSSPGVRRPIRREKDFRRFKGYRAKIQLNEPLDGRKNFLGRLGEIDNGHIVLEVDGREFKLLLDSIKKAYLDVEF